MSREITVSTASLLIDAEPSFPGACVQRAMDAVRIAGERSSDVFVLPEEFDIVGADATQAPGPHGICEPIPGGPITTRMQELARQYQMYIVSNIRELDGEVVYNTAALIGRDGEIVGKYRKTHLAPGEDEEVSRGDELPVFETDFGRLAVAICMDITYPEIFSAYGVKGADIVAWPTMSLDYTGDCTECCMKARAFDNQYYFVRSSYIQMPFLVGKSMGHACVIDPYARVIADSSHLPGVATVMVDLDVGYEFWGVGEIKARMPTLRETGLGMRRPELYQVLSEPDTAQLWRLRNPCLYAPAEAADSPSCGSGAEATERSEGSRS